MSANEYNYSQYYNDRLHHQAQPSVPTSSSPYYRHQQTANASYPHQDYQRHQYAQQRTLSGSAQDYSHWYNNSSTAGEPQGLQASAQEGLALQEDQNDSTGRGIHDRSQFDTSALGSLAYASALDTAGVNLRLPQLSTATTSSSVYGTGTQRLQQAQAQSQVRYGSPAQANGPSNAVIGYQQARSDSANSARSQSTISYPNRQPTVAASNSTATDRLSAAANYQPQVTQNQSPPYYDTSLGSGPSNRSTSQNQGYGYSASRLDAQQERPTSATPYTKQQSLSQPQSQSRMQTYGSFSGTASGPSPTSQTFNTFSGTRVNPSDSRSHIAQPSVQPLAQSGTSANQVSQRSHERQPSTQGHQRVERTIADLRHTLAQSRPNPSQKAHSQSNGSSQACSSNHPISAPVQGRGGSSTPVQASQHTPVNQVDSASSDHNDTTQQELPHSAAASTTFTTVDPSHVYDPYHEYQRQAKIAEAEAARRALEIAQKAVQPPASDEPEKVAQIQPQSQHVQRRPSPANAKNTVDKVAQTSNARSSNSTAQATPVEASVQDAPVPAQSNIGSEQAEKENMEAEMRQMVERMREYQTKDPSLFSQVWEQVKKQGKTKDGTPSLAKQVSSTLTGSSRQPSTSREAGAAVTVTVNRQLPSPSPTLAQPTSPPQPQKSTPAAVSQTNGEVLKTPSMASQTAENQVSSQTSSAESRPAPVPARELGLKSGTAAPNSAQATQTTAGSSQVSTYSPATQSWKPTRSSSVNAEKHIAPHGSPSAPGSALGTIWPESKKAALANAAVKALTAVPQNAGKTLLPEQICALLDKNPSYIELCESLENMDIFMDRAKFARTLLAAVPDANDTPAAPSEIQTPRDNRDSVPQTPASAPINSSQTFAPSSTPSNPLAVNDQASGSSGRVMKSRGRPRKDGTPAQPRKKAISDDNLPQGAFSKNYMATPPVAAMARSGTNMADTDSNHGSRLKTVSDAKQHIVIPAAQQAKSRGRPRKDGSPAQPRKILISDRDALQKNGLPNGSPMDHIDPLLEATAGRPSAAVLDSNGENGSRLQTIDGENTSKLKTNNETRRDTTFPVAQPEDALEQSLPSPAVSSTLPNVNSSHPYSCSQCFARFTGKDKLKRHLDVVHELIRHLCPHCGIGLTRPEHLRRHLQNVHSISPDILNTSGLTSQDAAASKPGLSRPSRKSYMPHLVQQNELQDAGDSHVAAPTRGTTSSTAQASDQQRPTPVANISNSTAPPQRPIYVNGNGNAFLEAAKRVSADVATMTSRYRLDNFRAYAADAATSKALPSTSQTNITEPNPKRTPLRTINYELNPASKPGTRQDTEISTKSMSKEEAARKRTFSEIVDLTQDLSEDEVSRTTKTPRLDNKNVVDDGDAPDSSQQDTSGRAIDLTTAEVSSRPGSNEQLQTDQARRHAQDAIGNEDVVTHIDRKKALRRSSYNPKTIARDVLLATGRHPNMRALNAHLDILKRTIKNVDNNSDLSTFKWDLVDPGGIVEDLGTKSGKMEDADVYADADDEDDGLTLGNENATSSPYFNNRRRLAATSGDQAEENTAGVEVVVAAKQLRGPRRRGPRTRGLFSNTNNPGLRSRPTFFGNAASGEAQSRSSNHQNNKADEKRSMQETTSTQSSAGDTGDPLTEGLSQPFGALNNTESPHRLPLRGIAESAPPFKKPRGRPRGSSRSGSLSSSGTPDSPGKRGGRTSSRGQSSIPERSRVSGNSTPSQPSGLRHASTLSEDFAVVIPSRSPSTASFNRNISKRTTAAGKFSQRSASMYQIYHCRWRNCKAELHNLETLRKHLRKIHRDRAPHGGLPCYWVNCGNIINEKDRKTGQLRKRVEALDFSSEASWNAHMDQEHLDAIAWTLGDGPSTERSDAHDTEISDYMSDNQGRQATPRALTEGSLDPPPAGLRPNTQFHKVHGNKSDQAKARVAQMSIERKKKDVGPGLDQGGSLLLNDRRRAAMIDDEDVAESCDEDEV
ncbi:MAG: hypothetical protein M1835_005721 [Candelina submexicana]|nr:MAG: hypothetical protein M1835_005721 [Candelina submexicana]